MNSCSLEAPFEIQSGGDMINALSRALVPICALQHAAPSPSPAVGLLLSLQQRASLRTQSIPLAVAGQVTHGLADTDDSSTTRDCPGADMTEGRQVLDTAKAALNSGLITSADYDSVKDAFLRAQQIKAGLDAGFILESDYNEVKQAFLHSLRMHSAPAATAALGAVP